MLEDPGLPVERCPLPNPARASHLQQGRPPTTIRTTLGALLLAGALLAPAAEAADEINASPGLSAAGAPLALHGYDPVAYFTEGGPVRGSDTLTHVHDGVAYRFASAAHRAAFVADPGRYVPQYGGFCAYGVAVGKKFDGDPHFWLIEGGRLYLNLNEEIYATFLEDVDGHVVAAHDL